MSIADSLLARDRITHLLLSLSPGIRAGPVSAAAICVRFYVHQPCAIWKTLFPPSPLTLKILTPPFLIVPDPRVEGFHEDIPFMIVSKSLPPCTLSSLGHCASDWLTLLHTDVYGGVRHSLLLNVSYS